MFRKFIKFYSSDVGWRVFRASALGKAQSIYGEILFEGSVAGPGGFGSPPRRPVSGYDLYCYDIKLQSNILNTDLIYNQDDLYVNHDKGTTIVRIATEKPIDYELVSEEEYISAMIIES